MIAIHIDCMLADTGQISNFLKYMATNIKLDSVAPMMNGKTTESRAATTLFDPVQRRLHILDT